MESSGKEKTRLEILYDGHYYDVTDFVRRHPGGREIIGFYTHPNEDATIPIQQFHARSLDKVTGIMKTLKRRRAPEIPEAEVSAIKKKIQMRNKELTEDFTKLYLELKAEGLFQPSYFHIAWRLMETLLFAFLGLYLITNYSNFWTKLLGCFIFATAQARAGWLQHEGGHLSLTGNPKLDRLLQVYLLGSIEGWSAIMWRRHHNLHHAMTQRIGKDIDLDVSPIFLLNIDVLHDPSQVNHPLYKYQLWFAPFFVPLGELYFCVWKTGRCLLKYRVPEEIFAIGIFYVIAYWIGLWPWIFTRYITMSYFFVNFGLSHTHLPVTNKPTHWVEHALVHTADVEQRPWCDWWMGYLNYQIEHHLFPTMPEFRNKLAVERVKALSQKHGLPYNVYSYKEAIVRMVCNVWDVTQKVKQFPQKSK
ncbi:unnamed protein product [Orchesella dallaii]|uniref:Fatty acid desaturase 2 n=1 Tax=Orchesella dallaii TaxID=48710 RepID=A0ABP1QEX1_9HEXA